MESDFVNPLHQTQSSSSPWKGRVVIFGAGTGKSIFHNGYSRITKSHWNPVPTSFWKERVDGIYDADPEKFKDAVKYDTVTFDEVYEKD